MKRVLKMTAGLLLVAALLLAASTVYMGRNTYDITNRVLSEPPYPAVSAAAQALHDRLFIADLHADTFNFDTDFLRGNGDAGQVDLQRARDGGFNLMTFAIATEIPFAVMRRDPAGNRRGGNLVTLGSVAELEPPLNWVSQYARGSWALDRARLMIRNNPDKLKLVIHREDVEELEAAHAAGEDAPLGVLFAVEGSHILDGNPDHLSMLHIRDVRMMSLTHAFDNEAGGSSEGVGKGGLTPWGEQLLRRLESYGIIIDIAHASPAMVDEILDRVSSPVVYSHGGIEGRCDIDRNLRDAALERIRDNGGLVAIGLWGRVLCGETLADVTASMRYVADRIGVEHVALGSDFDGGVTTLFDASGMPQLTAALLEAEFSEADIAAIMGGNYLRLLKTALPPRPTR